MYISLACDASGDLVKTVALEGRFLLYGIEFILGTFASGVDVTVEVVDRDAGTIAPDKTLLTLTNLSADGTYRPRVVEHDAAGAALTTTTLMVIDGDIKVTVADGGVSKAGALSLVLIPGLL